MNGGLNTAGTGLPAFVKKAAHKRLGYLVDEIENLAECSWMLDNLADVLQREMRADNIFLDTGTCRELIENYVTERAG